MALSTGSARAQAPDTSTPHDEEAHALFVAGRSAFDGGRFEDALDDFQRSYALTPHPELLYNIAVCHDRLRHDERALARYREYLDTAGETPHRVAVQGRVAALQAALDARAAEAEEAEAQRARAERAEATRLEAQRRDEERRRVDAARVAPDEEERGGGLAQRWWFWTAVGAVVAGGVVAGVLVANRGGEQGALPGDYGVIVMTLGQR